MATASIHLMPEYDRVVIKARRDDKPGGAFYLDVKTDDGDGDTMVTISHRKAEVLAGLLYEAARAVIRASAPVLDGVEGASEMAAYDPEGDSDVAYRAGMRDAGLAAKVR